MMEEVVTEPMIEGGQTITTMAEEGKPENQDACSAKLLSSH
jgi:hypothetical protein